MKYKTSILIITFAMLSYAGFSQDDSVRTRNDKPGTPSSLRTPDNSPQNGDPLINRQRPQVGSINHTGVESNNVTHPDQQTYVNGSVNQTNDNQTRANTSAAGTNVQNGTDAQNSNNNINRSTPSDSVIINGAYYQKPSNVTNPVKHN